MSLLLVMRFFLSLLVSICLLSFLFLNFSFDLSLNLFRLCTFPSPFIYSSIHLSLLLFIFSPIHLSIHPPLHPSVYRSVNFYVCFVCPAVYLSIHPPIYSSIILSRPSIECIYWSFFPVICLSVYLSVCLSICLSIRLSSKSVLYVSNLLLYLFTRLMSIMYLFVSLSLCLSIAIYLSVYLCI